MAKKRPILGLTTRYGLARQQVYSRAIATAGSTAPSAPMAFNAAAQSSGNTPPPPPPPSPLDIYTMITQAADFLMTEDGDNITTQLQ